LPHKIRLTFRLVAVFIFMSMGMAAYELAKAFFFPHLTLWASHVVTIILSGAIATLAAYLILRKYHVLLHQLSQELAERQRAERALKRAHDELEVRVRDRTAALARVNEELRREISERLQAEEALRASEAKYRELVEHANSIILRMTPEGQITFFNEFAQRFFGYDEAEIIGRNVISTIVPATESTGRDLKDLMAGVGQHPERYASHENENITRSGERVWISWTNRAVLDEAGNIKEILCVGNDVTARQRAEELLARQAQELARSNADLEQFAYVVSHDLQEPLHVVGGFVHLIARRYQEKLDDKGREFIAQTVEGVNRLQQMIRDLLEYSRVTTRGKEFAPVDCSVLLNQVLGDLSLAIAERGAVITVDPLPTVTADAAQLARLFQNLISNALKFCRDRTPQVHIGAEPGEHEWRFWVRDNGIGIAPEDSGRIFGMFERLHDRGDYPGTGIGLAVCQKIVERHGGRIWVESQPGEGATFYFNLPDRGSAAGSSLR
jgi:PAS domain S-box-containing protein